MIKPAPILACVLALVAPARAGALTPGEAHAMAKAGDIVLVDVRTPKEWARTGLPAHARCATGVRSAFARRMLEAAGFTDVDDVAAGVAGRGEVPGWLAAGLPIEACGVC